MKNILIVTNECYKSKSANGFCLENVINELRKHKQINIDIVTYYKKNEIERRFCNVEVHYVKNCLFERKNCITDIICKVVNKIVYETISPDINILYYFRTKKKLQELCKKKKYCAVITSSGGYMAQLMGLFLKERYGTAWITYFLDPPIKHNFLYKKNKLYYKKSLRLEENVFDKSDKIILETSLYKAMKNTKFREKMVKTGLPLIVDRRIEHTKNSNKETIDILFIGTLWKDIRNPRYAVELLSSIPNVQVDFYGGQQTESVLEEYVSEKIRYCGELEHDQISECIKKYDYLLNISNVNCVQTPSKLFEYISYLKPIINIVKDSKDITKEIVASYGNGISLIENDTENNDLIKKYFNSEKKPISCKQIEDIFEINTPRYTAQIIHNFINE